MTGARPLSEFHHVALTVSDCEASTRWYVDVLGLEVKFTEDSEERRGSILGFASGRYAVGLVEHRGSASDPFDFRVTGLDHVGFAVGDRAELEAWTERLAAHGVAHSGVIEIPAGWILNFKDPDGIALSLFADAPS